MKRTWLVVGLAVIVTAMGIWWSGTFHRPLPQLREPGSTQATNPNRTTQNSSGSDWATSQPAGINPFGEAVVQHAGTPVLSTVIERVLGEPERTPRAAELQPLSASEEAALVQAYKQIESITNKLGIVFTLAYSGSSNVIDVLHGALTTEYAHRRFEDSVESATLSCVVWFMGMLAERDDRALAFLQAGVSPHFWRTHVTWRGPHREPFELLSRHAIKGLAVSGRAEAWRTVLSLASHPPPGFADYHTIAGAAYYHEMLQTHGKAWVWDNCPGNFNAKGAWFRSESGRPWWEWQQRMGRMGMR
jgi:hypothetical protein